MILRIMVLITDSGFRLTRSDRERVGDAVRGSEPLQLHAACSRRNGAAGQPSLVDTPVADDPVTRGGPSGADRGQMSRPDATRPPVPLPQPIHGRWLDDRPARTDSPASASSHTNTSRSGPRPRQE